MKFPRIVQLAIFFIGVYCSNVISMDEFNDHSFIHVESDLEDLCEEGPSCFNMIHYQQVMPTRQQMVSQPQIIQQMPPQQQATQMMPIQQQMTQMIQNQQQMIQNQQQMIQQIMQQQIMQQQMILQMIPIHQQIASVSRNPVLQPTRSMPPTTALIASKKPAPVVPRKAIAAPIVQKNPTMWFIASRKRGEVSCDCRKNAKNIPNKLITPQAVSIDFANEFLTHKYVCDDDHYYPYPKPSEALFYQDTTPVAEKEMKYKSAFRQVLQKNIEIADENLLNPGPKEKYIELMKAIEVLDILNIKYNHPGIIQGTVFPFEPTFYNLNKASLNASIPLDEHGLCPYPKPKDSSVCIKHYEQRFNEIAEHNRSVVARKFTAEGLKDYNDRLAAMKKITGYSLLAGKQNKIIDNNRTPYLCDF